MQQCYQNEPEVCDTECACFKQRNYLTETDKIDFNILTDTLSSEASPTIWSRYANLNITIIHFFRNWFLIWFINTEKFAFAWANVGLASPLATLVSFNACNRHTIESLSKWCFCQHGRQPCEVNGAVIDGEWWCQQFLFEINDGSVFIRGDLVFKLVILSAVNMTSSANKM